MTSPARPLRVLDLFAGLRGWSDPFAARGHQTLTVEYDYSFEGIDLYRDILNIDAGNIIRAWRAKYETYERFDIILASPPCTAFTTMTMGRNWEHGRETRPRTHIAEIGAALVRKTRELIQDLGPSYYIIENPRARLRTLDLIDDLPRATVWYCRYGEERAKPTDLFGIFPPSWTPRDACHNGNPDHTAAPRGSYTGTQGGVRGDIAAKIPHALATEVCDAVEHDIGA